MTPLRLHRAAGDTLELAEHRADVVAERVAGPLELALDDALTVSWDGARLALRFSDDAVGCGRTERSAPCDDLHDLRVLIDSSAVEVFANNGALAFATRWFPRSSALTIVEKGQSLFHIWEMESRAVPASRRTLPGILVLT